MAFSPSTASIDIFLYLQLSLYIALYAYKTQYDKSSITTPAVPLFAVPSTSPSPMPFSNDDDDTALDRSISAVQSAEAKLYDPLSSLMTSPHIQTGLYMLNAFSNYAQMIRELTDDIALFLFTIVIASLFHSTSTTAEMEV